MKSVFEGLKSAVNSGAISLERLEDAVARIIAVKLVFNVTAEIKKISH